MSLANAEYPDLKLCEYIFKSYLNKDEDWKKKVKEIFDTDKTPHMTCISFDAVVFPQMWGNTAAGIDCDEDGNPYMAGQALTKEYTTVIKENLTNTYAVFFGENLGYVVTDATPKFFKDLDKRNMAGRYESRRKY